MLQSVFCWNLINVSSFVTGEYGTDFKLQYFRSFAEMSPLYLAPQILKLVVQQQVQCQTDIRNLSRSPTKMLGPTLLPDKTARA